MRELGIGFVPYSPLGRGFLTGQFQKARGSLPPTTCAGATPGSRARTSSAISTSWNRCGDLAEKKGCQPAQLALAWVLAQGEDIIPIPGTRRVKYLDENIGSLDVQLTPADLAAIDEVLPHGATAGERYAPAQMKNLNR